jgi:uncharacterized damage-inducible protein DinB
MTLPLIRELHAYQAWADAEIFRLVEATPAAQSDEQIVKLLNHVEGVYRFFVLSIQGEPPTPEELMKERTLDELHASMQKIHKLADGYLPKVRESRLNDPVEVPWFKDFQPTCQEVLVQAVMHSQNHRGQLLTHLRTLGATTKPLDYIVWVSKGRPGPDWETATATA